MRTTIDLPDAQRARLLELAARRHEKGFSSIVQEAIEQYLDQEGGRADRLRAAIAVRGALAGRNGAHLAKSARTARAEWR